MTGLGKYTGLSCLLAMLVLTPLIIYRMAISSTVELRGAVEDQRKQIERFMVEKSAPSIHNTAIDSTIESSELVSLIEICSQQNDVYISKYTPYITSSEDIAEIATSEIILRGGFIQTVRVLHFIEQSIVECKVISVNFNAKIDRATQITILTTTILIQQIDQQ